MPLIAGYQVVDAGRVRAFQELVVVGILRNLDCTRGINELRMVLYELEELLPKASSDFEFRAREDFPVFRENGAADVQPGGSGHRKHEHGALESVRFQSRRDEDICVKDEPKRDHWRTDHRCTNQPRFGFCARVALRVALMTPSIWLELSVFVPLRRDSSPISLSTSGSGAASRT
jgi:hypothetical protein